MIINLTYHCSMGCKHCMSDCKPDGSHMSIETLKDVLDFHWKNSIYGVQLSGGEIFEHPQIIECLDLVNEHMRTRLPMPIILITNGRILSSDLIILEKVKELRRYWRGALIIQVTDDNRFYPTPLNENQKYRLKKLGAIIDTVPTNKSDQDKCLYPQGRALENYDERWWNTNCPKCTNVRLVALQKQGCTFGNLVTRLMAAGFMCTPMISPKGEIKLGESALCPPVASIYDTDEEIMKKILSFKCNACTIPLDKFKSKNPELCSLVFQ